MTNRSSNTSAGTGTSEIEDDVWARRVSSGVAAGSRTALASLYERRFERMFHFVRERTRRDDAFALDCVHDAWLRVVRGLPPLGSLAALDAWLMRTAISAALDRIKSDSARSRRETTPAAPERVTVLASDRERSEELTAELESLPAPDRWVLDLRFHRGLSLETIAGALGIGAKSAESRLRRALMRLRGRMEAGRE